MKCYYNDEGEPSLNDDKKLGCQLTNVAATKETLDPEGWLDTGDAGYIDEEGFLFIKDRRKLTDPYSEWWLKLNVVVKDIIIRGGENVSPSQSAMYTC